MIEAKVILDSVTPRGHRPIEQGYRLTTVEVTIPRIVLAEFNTHRVFSRNSASSRAIPVEKQIEKVLTDPFIPTEFGSNKSGMQAGEPLTGDDRAQAIFSWLDARDAAVSQARKMLDLGVHKQITNRLLEPFMYHTIICSSTEWDNFFAQRCSPLAQPEIRLAAEAIREARAASTPQRRVFIDDPHLPYLRPEDDDWGQAGTLVREVLDDAARDRLAHNVIGHVSKGVREPVLSRVFEYWRAIDADLGKKIEEGVRANLDGNGG